MVLVLVEVLVSTATPVLVLMLVLVMVEVVIVLMLVLVMVEVVALVLVEVVMVEVVTLVLVLVVMVEVVTLVLVVLLRPSQMHAPENWTQVAISEPVSFQHFPAQVGKDAVLQFPHTPFTSMQVSLAKNEPVRPSTQANSVGVSTHLGPGSPKQHAPNPSSTVVLAEVLVPVVVGMVQLMLHADPPFPAPSSHSSGGSTIPSPHTGTRLVEVVDCPVGGPLVVEDAAHSSSQDDRFRKNSPPSLQHSSKPHSPEHRPSGRQQ